MTDHSSPANASPIAYVPRSKAPGCEGEPLWREVFEAKWLSKGTWLGFDLMPLYAEPVISAQCVPWQPIETAQHETLVLLGWWYGGSWIMEVGEASHGWRRNGISNMSRHGQATHWMPLPAGPSFTSPESTTETEADASTSALSRIDGSMPQGPGAGDGQKLAAVGRKPATATNSPCIQPQRAPDGFVLAPQAALDWLFGEAPGPDGRWFGDREEIDGETTSKFYRRYWWRSKFRSMIPALTRPELCPTEKIDGSQS